MSDADEVSESGDLSVASDYEESGGSFAGGSGMILSQADMLSAWASRIKGGNSIYANRSVYYVRRAQSDGSLPDPEGGLPQEYGVGDYLMIDPKDGYAQFALGSAEFEQLFPGIQISEINPEAEAAGGGEEALAKLTELKGDGYRRYTQSEKHWVLTIAEEDLIGGAPTQFESPADEEERMTMRAGDMLALKWPTADEVSAVAAEDFANPDAWVDEAQQEAPPVPPSPSMRRPAVVERQPDDDDVDGGAEEGEGGGGAADAPPTPPPPPPLPSSSSTEGGGAPTAPSATAAAAAPPPAPAAAAKGTKDTKDTGGPPDWGKVCADFEINDKEFKALKRRFDSYDADASGTLDASELGNLLAKMGQEYSDAEVALILKQIDSDASGTVEFVEFLRWWTGHSEPAEGDAALKLVDKTKQELGSLIFLFREQFEDSATQKTIFRFTLEVSQPKDIEFTLDCSNCTNMEPARGESLVLKAKVSPYQKVVLGELRQVDAYEGYSVGYGMSWTTFPCTYVCPCAGSPVQGS